MSESPRLNFGHVDHRQRRLKLVRTTARPSVVRGIQHAISDHKIACATGPETAEVSRATIVGQITESRSTRAERQQMLTADRCVAAVHPRVLPTSGLAGQQVDLEPTASVGDDSIASQQAWPAVLHRQVLPDHIARFASIGDQALAHFISGSITIGTATLDQEIVLT